MYHYHAFGLAIASEIRLYGPSEEVVGPAEVTVRRGKLAWQRGVQRRRGEVLLGVPEAGAFCCRDGTDVIVDALPQAPETLLSVYILGACTSAILYQRGGMLLHASCVARDGTGVLLLGDSGAGKSTLARALICRGWQMVTDDVASIVFREEPCVQSSFPYQMLWQDAAESGALKGEPLRRQGSRELLGVEVTRCFREGLTPLKMAIRLVQGDECACMPLTGADRAEHLLRCTCRPYLLPREQRTQHLQRCAELAEMIDMYLCVRDESAGAAERLCGMLETVLT